MRGPRFRSVVRRISLLTTLPALTTAVWLMAAGPTVACSCMAPGPIETYATAENAIFSGTAGPRDALGVPVRVATWFSGEGAAPMVYLAASSFGDSASCGTAEPPPGSAWLWVAYRSEGELYAGLCSPHGQLGTPEGDALLAEATKAYGGVALSDPSEPPEAAPSAPVPAEMAPVILAGTIGIGVVMFVGVALLARRRNRAV
jgi:hypothetical protein